MSELDKFLETKELFYKDIDYNFMPNIWHDIKDKFKLPKIIHVIGTNGKGSSGRFLAYYLYKYGFKVGHFTSPHIVKFHERFWINNRYANSLELNNAHILLLNKLDKKTIEKISYFEYATLLAIELFSECDYVVLEAGLGGEYDATNVFDKLFTLVTPISYDHQNFLGNSIKDIATTKLNSISTFALVSKQTKEVQSVIKDMNKKFYFSDDILDINQHLQLKEFIDKNSFASYLEQNLILAMSAVIKLGLKVDLEYLEGVKLFGRCYKIASNITIDVGHNLLAADAIKKEFKGRKIVLVYNTYCDKDYFSILQSLRPIIKRVEVLEINNERVVDIKNLRDTLEKLDIKFKDFKIVDLKEDEEYLVFGSFSVVEQFLKNYSTICKIDYL